MVTPSDNIPAGRAAEGIKHLPTINVLEASINSQADKTGTAESN